MTRFLVLAYPDDDTALRVFGVLVARFGTGAVRLVTAEELALASFWLHRLGRPLEAQTGAHSAVTLADGAVLDPEEIGVVFNRLRYAVAPQFARARQADLDYALMETYALWLSWLAALPCPVVNQATARGLGLQSRSLAEWLSLAVQAGLPVQDFFFTSDPRRYRAEGLASYRRQALPDAAGNYLFEPVALPNIERRPAFYLGPPAAGDETCHVLVAGEGVIAAPTADLSAPCGRLAALAGCALLQIDFARSEHSAGWQVRGATSYPVTSDPVMVNAIADLLDTAGRPS